MRIASASPFVSVVISLSFVVLCAEREAHAQSTDLIGVRAQGMGGAFTAVADDSTATWWNPAGLAGGAYFNALIEYDRLRNPSGEAFGGAAIAFPALGLSYYRLPLSQIQSETTTGVTAGSRQHEGVLSVYGASVGQSVGNHLVVGSTLKLVRAGEWKGGLDLGAMAAYGHARLGLMVRNAREAEFNSGTPEAWKLKRQARAGAAYTSGARGAVGAATVAVDADLTSTNTIHGAERKLAAGAEVWTPKHTFGVRGGYSASTIGERRGRWSGGASASVRPGAFVDAHITGGTNADRQVWGFDLRLTF
jgi:hypothetical protein